VATEISDEPLFRPGGAGMTCADVLVRSVEEYWPQVRSHPLCREAAADTLDDDAFERWMIADYAFNLNYRRFLAGLMTIAPTGSSAEVVSLCLPAINRDTNLIMDTARRHGIDLNRSTGPTTISFVSYMQALLPQGYATALAAYYMCEKVYMEGWSAVRPTAERTSEYWPFIDNWSSAASARMNSASARLVNSAAPRGPTDAMLTAVKRVIRFELSFWNAIYGGETW
jgi:thiaminase/transcriptional activator TenA